MDLSFKNELINNYFKGNDDYVPVSELMYIHEHPLIRNTFLAEIETTIYKVRDLLVAKKMTGVVIDKFSNYTIQLGAELPNLSRQNAPTVLNILRNIYNLGKELLKQ